MSLILLSTWSIFLAGWFKGAVLSNFWLDESRAQGGHSEPLLLLALFYQSTPSCLKVGGGVVAYVIIVSAQVPLVLTLGLWTLGLRTRAWQLGSPARDVVVEKMFHKDYEAKYLQSYLKHGGGDYSCFCAQFLSHFYTGKPFFSKYCNFGNWFFI